MPVPTKMSSVASVSENGGCCWDSEEIVGGAGMLYEEGAGICAVSACCGGSMESL